MWQRFKRVMRSFAGWFVSLGEDPELILKQNRRDLEDKVSELNEHLSMIGGQKNLAERELKRVDEQEKELVAKIKAALKQGRRDIALQYATEHEKVKGQKVTAAREVERMTATYENAQKAKKQFMIDKERKIQEAQKALNEARRTQMTEKVADAMGNFQVAGIDATHEEMVRRLEEKSAMADAKLETAMSAAGTERAEVDEAARKIQAEDTLRQFEIEMGLATDASAAPQTAAREKTIGPQEREKA